MQFAFSTAKVPPSPLIEKRRSSKPREFAHRRLRSVQPASAVLSFPAPCDATGYLKALQALRQLILKRSDLASSIEPLETRICDAQEEVDRLTNELVSIQGV